MPLFSEMDSKLKKEIRFPQEYNKLYKQSAYILMYSYLFIKVMKAEIKKNNLAEKLKNSTGLII